MQEFDLVARLPLGQPAHRVRVLGVWVLGVWVSGCLGVRRGSTPAASFWLTRGDGPRLCSSSRPQPLCALRE